MNADQSALLRQIDALIEAGVITKSALGRRAVNDWKFVDRLRAGENMTIQTIDKVKAFLASEATL